MTSAVICTVGLVLIFLAYSLGLGSWWCIGAAAVLGAVCGWLDET